MRTFPRKPPSDDHAIEARAAAWLAQRDDGLGEAEQREFDRWRAADPRHAAAVARLEATWSALLQLRDYRPTARAHPDRDILAPRKLTHRLPYLRPLLVAATVAILAGGAWQASRFALRPAAAPTEVYSTTVGGYQRVTLSDGSVLRLNDRTEVRVDFTDSVRRLHLLRGQAHFSVAKNKARPFIVATSSVAVRAVGTAFDVRLGDSEVEVLVTEGTVQLDRSISDARPADNSAPPSLLTAGWRAMIPHDQRVPSNLARIDAAGVREALSWQGPRLVFVETPLSEVIAQINRRNRTQILLADPSLADLHVGGSFRAENVEAFVRLLASSGDISVEHDGERFVLNKAR